MNRYQVIKRGNDYLVWDSWQLRTVAETNLNSAAYKFAEALNKSYEKVL